MSVAGLELPRELRRPGDTDAVTFSFADPGAGLYGLLRVASGVGAGGATTPSALVVAFAGRDTLAAVAEAGEAAPVALTATVEEPLERWTVSGAGELPLELRFDALSPPAEYGGRQAVARAGGLEGYEQVCQVRGTVAGRAVEGLGQRGHTWGNPDWDKIALTRSVGVWLEDGSGLVVASVRPAGKQAHADEAIWAAALDVERARAVDDPRLSTTTDGDGRQIRAGVELWLDKDDDYPLRGAGEVVTGSTLQLGALRLDCAFFRWHVEGRAGVGRYDIIRRA